MYAAYAMIAKTMSSRLTEKKCGFVKNLTRKGRCPQCGAQIERICTDIFFPYCGYKCKRVIQRKEEEEQKQRIAQEQSRYMAFLEKEKQRNAQNREKKREESHLETVRNRLALCQSKYDQYEEACSKLPLRCEKRWRAEERKRFWYKKIVEAKNAVEQAEEEEERKHRP